MSPIPVVRPEPGSPEDIEARARIRRLQVKIRSMLEREDPDWQSIACYAMTLEMARLLRAIHEDERFVIMEHYIHLLQTETLS